jgi:hypothetical protein
MLDQFAKCMAWSMKDAVDGAEQWRLAAETSRSDSPAFRSFNVASVCAASSDDRPPPICPWLGVIAGIGRRLAVTPCYCRFIMSKGWLPVALERTVS